MNLFGVINFNNYMEKNPEYLIVGRPKEYQNNSLNRVRVRISRDARFPEYQLLRSGSQQALNAFVMNIKTIAKIKKLGRYRSVLFNKSFFSFSINLTIYSSPCGRR